jgi:hypothetical protein
MSRMELFLAHLDRLSGGVEPQLLRIDSSRPGLRA